MVISPFAVTVTDITCDDLDFVHCSIEYNISYVYHALHAFFDR